MVKGAKINCIIGIEVSSNRSVIGVLCARIVPLKVAFQSMHILRATMRCDTISPSIIGLWIIDEEFVSICQNYLGEKKRHTWRTASVLGKNKGRGNLNLTSVKQPTPMFWIP